MTTVIIPHNFARNLQVGDAVRVTVNGYVTRLEGDIIDVTGYRSGRPEVMVGDTTGEITGNVVAVEPA